MEIQNTALLFRNTETLEELVLFGLCDICFLAQHEILCERGKTYVEGAIYEDALGLHF